MSIFLFFLTLNQEIGTGNSFRVCIIFDNVEETHYKYLAGEVRPQLDVKVTSRKGEDDSEVNMPLVNN